MVLLVGLAALSALSPHQLAHAAAKREAERGAAVERILRSLPPTLSAATPSLPSFFSARYAFEELIDGKSSSLPDFMERDQRLAQDTKQMRRAEVRYTKMVFGPKEYVGTPLEWVNFTTYFFEDYMGIDFNGALLDACMYGGKFSDMFGWVSHAQDGGRVVVDGKALHRWMLTAPTVHFELLIDSAGTPYRYIQNISKSALVPHAYYMNYTFHEFASDDSLLPKAWEGVTIDGFKKPKPCPPPADPTPLNKTMYIFHPKHEFNISQQDLGDATGDTFFVCVDALTKFNTSIDHNYAWISAYHVQFMPQYGQYLNCNGYPSECLGANNFLVGHEAAQGQGFPEAGQCNENPLVGEWWALPEGGKCADGATPGDGTCSWRATRLKTIDSPCLFDQLGFVDTCRKEGRAPFAQSSKLLVKAFAQDSVHGGCPALPV
ncbi:hypothetical protein AB1Y20_022005 [Prymnesium parvum]|uniref:Amine oxidase n=1 Tax=Prymnesium parvum TaxID=97485 RepID=A0AB34JG07_PRYPA